MNEDREKQVDGLNEADKILREICIAFSVFVGFFVLISILVAHQIITR